MKLKLHLVGFNPRTREGCDQECEPLLSGGVFQSTHPRGVRRLLRSDIRASIRVSIHAPARGATVANFGPGDLLGVSIHAPARGATPHQLVADRLDQVSIHAPARGATLPSLRVQESHRFQSTHPRGVRQTRQTLSTS